MAMTSTVFQIDDIVATLIALLVRWCVSLNPYSGKGKPPMYGDYEAQRHWMELTNALPVRHWYFESPNNNLSYWGIDYPPLTAYHMWLCGAIAKYINPAWVELNTSHGFESPNHQLFMRYTVMAPDLFFYIIPVLLFSKMALHNRSRIERFALTVLILLQPANLLIDHGHFQYNCISLGLALIGFILIAVDNNLCGAIAFTLALNYKQMELYHALPFFCYLLGISIRSSRPIIRIVNLGVIVLVTFAICWLPFLFDTNQITQIIRRLFPFERGLYEDKVSNVWCTLNVAIKLRQLFSQQVLIRFSLFATLATVLPSSIHLVIYPSIEEFLIALANSSLAFFLFSYQVHEKSILLACMPVSLLLPWKPDVCGLFLLIATFSMTPLIIKDGLLLPYISLMLLYLWLLHLILSTYYAKKSYRNVLYVCTTLIMVAMHFYGAFYDPPLRYPDLVAVMISGFSCISFLSFLLYMNYWQFALTENSINITYRKSKSD